MARTKQSKNTPKPEQAEYPPPEFVLEIGSPMPEGWKVLSKAPEWADERSRLTHAARQGQFRHARVGGGKGHGMLIFQSAEVNQWLADNPKLACPQPSFTPQPEGERQLSLLAADCTARMIETNERLIESTKLMTDQQAHLIESNRQLAEQQKRLTAAIELLLSIDSSVYPAASEA